MDTEFSKLPADQRAEYYYAKSREYHVLALNCARQEQAMTISEKTALRQIEIDAFEERGSIEPFVIQKATELEEANEREAREIELAKTRIAQG